MMNNITDWIKKIPGRINSFFKRTAQKGVTVVERSWKGAAIGAVIAMIIHLAISGQYIKTGLSPVVDILLLLLLMALIIIGTGLLSKSLFGLLRRFNPLFVGAFTGTFIVAGFLPNSFFGKPFILLGILFGGMLGFAIAYGIKRYLSILVILVVLIGNGFLVYFLAIEGLGSSISFNDDHFKKNLPSHHFDDPSLEGSFEVKEMFYGSGVDKRRQEYAGNADILTTSVDATPFFDQSKGIKNFFRRVYWGFDSRNYPINARVWHPEGEGLFPLVIIVHGNHLMHEYSDSGYEYLGRLLASRGYIAVSVDENYLNGSWMGDYEQSEIFTRAWLLLKHLENWRDWNETEGNPFYQSVDMDKIALIGHSRGGAAVATASVINKLNRYHIDANQTFNFNFSIKGIIQIAPNDPYYPQNGVLPTPENIDFLALQGGYDQDMYWYLANRVYNRVKFTDDAYHFKSALYIYRANHGQFNTVWGRNDNSMPSSWFLNKKHIMEGEEQRRIAKVYISAFLEASLHEREEYIHLLRDFRQANSFLPRDYYISQFEDSEFKYITDYQEDFDVHTTSSGNGRIEGANLKTWSENALPFRDKEGTSQMNSGVYLGWDKNDTLLKGVPHYSITIPDTTIGKGESAPKNLFFFICNNKNSNDTVDFTIELVTPETCTRTTLGIIRTLAPPLKTKLTKTDFIFTMAKDKPVERVLQYVEIPLSEFVKSNKEFVPSGIVEIRFVFDKTSSGEIFLDKVGFN